MLKPFRMQEPTTIEEAASELDDEQARVYAGGAELILLLRHGLIEAGTLVNIKGISDLKGTSWDGSHFNIGATVTHRRLETDPLVHQHLPLLAYAESHIGNIRVRCQGTLGGNLCFADPHADPATALLVHDAMVGIAGHNGYRELPLDKFLVGMYETALQPDELLTQVKVPPLPSRWGHGYLRIEQFYRPTVNVAAAAKFNNGTIDSVRFAVGCVGPKAQRLPELEDKLSGSTLADAERITAEAKPYLTEQLQPIDDLLGSADYKIHVTGVLLKNALNQSVQSGRELGRGR